MMPQSIWFLVEDDGCFRGWCTDAIVEFCGSACLVHRMVSWVKDLCIREDELHIHSPVLVQQSRESHTSWYGCVPTTCAPCMCIRYVGKCYLHGTIFAFFQSGLKNMCGGLSRQ